MGCDRVQYSSGNCTKNGSGDLFVADTFNNRLSVS